MKKLFSTVRILYCLFMARTFGRYLHSVSGPNQPNCAVYEWRGRRWWVPTEALDARWWITTETVARMDRKP